MNIERLTEIKERVEKATSGPWRYSEQYGYLAPVIPQRQVAVICNEISRKDDAEFIENAREDVPVLIEEVERLREALESLQKELITTRGINREHDNDITGMCIKIRKVLDGEEYEE